MRTRRLDLVPAILLFLLLPTALLGQQPALTGFDAFVEEVMEEWGVPGLAVGALEEGEVVLARGYGYRDVEGRRPVTPSTLFAIGSTTKSFTATLVGMLVDDGDLAWDAPVREYVPEFRLRDPVASKQASLIDLLSHRSGLPAHDTLWYGRDRDREALFRRLRRLEPSAPFRSVFQYQNLMFMAAGHIAGRVAGESWEALIRERILEPLGMRRTNLSVTTLQRDDDFAYPYEARGDEVVRVPFRSLDAIGPAGSINSSVEEMLRYLRFRLALGEWQGSRLLSATSALEMETPHTAIPQIPGYPEVGYASYGLGVMLTTYRGHRMVTHNGGIDGFASTMAWLPDDSIAVVVLTNLTGNPLPAIVGNRLLDRLLGLPPIDWAGRVRAGEEAEGPE